MFGSGACHDLTHNISKNRLQRIYRIWDIADLGFSHLYFSCKNKQELSQARIAQVVGYFTTNPKTLELHFSDFSTIFYTIYKKQPKHFYYWSYHFAGRPSERFLSLQCGPWWRGRRGSGHNPARAGGGVGRGRVRGGARVARAGLGRNWGRGWPAARLAAALGGGSRFGPNSCVEGSGVVRLGRALARVSAREVVGRVNSACGRLELGARRGDP
jgi:hypothetical protein